MLNLCFDELITTRGWDTFFSNFIGNDTLEYLDLSGHDNISVPNLMSALTNNSTLKTLNLEYLFADFNGLRWVANFLKSPKCALENIYLEGNHEGGETVAHLALHAAAVPRRRRQDQKASTHWPPEMTHGEVALRMPRRDLPRKPRVGPYRRRPQEATHGPDVARFGALSRVGNRL